ncbi:hypothetical protein [Dialister invisus]|uniref:hypothetical protein n=1 Tax=Dialister invisus TaxID=218538 RepID=UPI00265E7156|nr:hypothetical protein [Dialister invisus]
MTTDGKSVILNECEGSAAVVRKTVRCHQSDRFFTPCHIAASLFSYTAFLPPLRMTTDGKSVIRSECEVSVPMVRKTIRRHSERSEESMTVVRKPVSCH